MKTYAQAQSRGRMTVDGLAKHMAQHNTPLSRGTIKAVLEDFIDCTRELILDGWIVDLGNMGTFNVSLKSTGVCESKVDEDTGEKPVFTTSAIKEVNCWYTPGPAFENMIADAEFTEVDTRENQRKGITDKNDKIVAGTYAKNQNGQ
ncbi:MAG: hypothetical protein MJZ35_00005 [Bacteroidaceae bacterium]|nr:hypothetical protein [Bacteroidaceae bacterium]